MESILLYTKRMLLRPYEERDAAAVQHVMAHPQVYAFTAHIPHSCTRAYAARWIRSVRGAMHRRVSFEFAAVDRVTGTYIGNIGIVRVCGTPPAGEITYWIAPPYQHRGLATEGARAVIEWAVRTLGVRTVTGCCMSHNAASRRVMEKLGFQFTARTPHALLKDDTWVDLDHLIWRAPK